MVKRYECPILLMEDIDHTMRNVVFNCLVVNVYGNLSISCTSPSKYMASAYLHAYVIDIVGTSTITFSIRRSLIKTHVEFIKKSCFLWLENFFVKAKIDYDKGYYNQKIELSTTTKMKTIPTFDPLVKLHFLLKDTICNFSFRMLQQFATTTIVFVIIGVCGDINSKFELLVVDENNLKNIQIISL